MTLSGPPLSPSRVTSARWAFSIASCTWGFPSRTVRAPKEGNELKDVLDTALEGDKGKQLWSFPKSRLKRWRPKQDGQSSPQSALITPALQPLPQAQLNKQIQKNTGQRKRQITARQLQCQISLKTIYTAPLLLPSKQKLLSGDLIVTLLYRQSGHIFGVHPRGVKTNNCLGLTN